jgi:ribonuclease HI
MEKKQLFDDFKELGIEIKILEKYLGVMIKMSEGNEIITDTRFSKISKDSICLNRAICFAIKVLIFEGALIARLRYSCMMISLKQKAERAYLFQNVWNFYRNDIKKLSYVQLATFSFNLFRMCIDLSVVKEIQEAVEDQANIDDNLYSEWIKTKLVTGIEVVDKVIDKCEFKIIKIEKVNMWYVKRICDELWKEYRRKSISCWMEEHKEKGIFVNEDMDKIIDSKLYRNSIIIQEILFRHLEYQDLKWILFIRSILSQLVDYVSQESDILPNFKMIPLVKISSKKDDDEKLVQLLMKEYYKEFDRMIEVLLEVEKDRDQKIKFKKILEILLLMEDIRISSKWSKMDVEDWIYAINVKIKIQEDNITKYVSMVAKGTLADDTDVLDNEQLNEFDNVLVIDGSYNEKENKIGSGFVIKNAKDSNNKPIVQLEGKYYSTINEDRILKQETGEYKALLLGLAYMKKANVKKVNVIYDFIGCERYATGKWNTNIKVQKFVRAFHEITGGMTVNFWKVKAHNGITLNEDANRLSRVGSGLEMPEPEDRVMEEINYEGLMDFATQPNLNSNSCLII